MSTKKQVAQPQAKCPKCHEVVFPGDSCIDREISHSCVDTYFVVRDYPAGAIDDAGKLRKIDERLARTMQAALNAFHDKAPIAKGSKVEVALKIQGKIVDSIYADLV
jgi:hypothetical protein